MLVEIIQNRLVDARRQEIATDARASLAAFHRGELPAHLPKHAPANGGGCIRSTVVWPREDSFEALF
jgi:hypothetical protein